MARSDADAWAAWHEDSFKLDVESPLTITRSLWDELSPNETDSRTLFSATPAAEVTETGALLSSLSSHHHHQDLTQARCDGEPDSPRQKRRRVLFFSHTGYELSQTQEMLQSSAWCPDTDDPRPAADGWMETCFNDSEDHQSTGSFQVPLCQTASESSDCMQQDASSRGPVTPISVTRPARAGRRRGHLQQQQQQQQQQRLLHKVASPVAYPFALVKPCGATGDVTLSDLNQRLQTPRGRPNRRLSGELSDAAAQGAAGLSGKSVVALTKIHTEGNGSITIMRTKG